LKFTTNTENLYTQKTRKKNSAEPIIKN